jgi:hypothetical protein
MHDIEQRAAKWLLLCRDRVDDDSFALTKEFFAIMLGVTCRDSTPFRRPSLGRGSSATPGAA